MDLFRILLNRILHKIPLKFLLLIIIFLLLALFCFNAKEVKASSTTIEYSCNGVNYKVYIPEENKGAVLVCHSNGVPYRTYYGGGSGAGLTPYIVNSTTPTTITNVATAIAYAEYTYNSSTGVYNATYKGFVSQPISIASGDFVCYAYQQVKVGSSSGELYLNSHTINTRFVGEPITAPSITNSFYISSWSFDNLIIDSGHVTGHYSITENNIIYQYVRDFKLEITYQGVVYTIDLRPYMSVDSNDKATFTIPKNELTNHINLYNGNTIAFDLFVQPDDNPNSTGNWSTYSLGTYTLSLTTDEEEQANADSTKQVLGDINNSIQTTNNNINNLNNTQQQTNSKIDNLESSITSSFYNDTDLSNTMHNFGNGFVVTDNTHLDDLFTMLYNAFCNNQVVNLTFTIPFVNKSVTISSANISANYPQQLVTIVHLFVWGMIGVFIIKDIRSMINKMAEGNIENISHDVKKEVL